jgi:hypothetical protein
MTAEFREIISHPNERWDRMRMLMAIVPAADNRNGRIVLKLQKQMGEKVWDCDNEYVAYLSYDDIGRLLTVFDGHKEGVSRLGYGDTKVDLIHKITTKSDSEYWLDLYDTASARTIALSTHEAIIIREILRTSIFRIVFG